MFRSTSILTSLFVFAAALTANAQDHRHDHAGHDHSDHHQPSHVGHNHNSPIIDSPPPLPSFTPYNNGSQLQLPASTPYKYAPPATLGQQSQIWNDPSGRTQGCYGGQCNPVRHGGLSTSRSTCPNGNCGQRSNGFTQPHLTQGTSFNRPYGSAFPRNYGAASTPYSRSPLQLNVTSSPYQGLSTIPRSAPPSYQRQPTIPSYQGRSTTPSVTRPFSQPRTNNPFYN